MLLLFHQNWKSPFRKWLKNHLLYQNLTTRCQTTYVGKKDLKRFVLPPRIILRQLNSWNWSLILLLIRFFDLPAQFSPVNPFSQVQIPLEKSHVPWDGSVQSSGHGQVVPEQTKNGGKTESLSKSNLFQAWTKALTQ